MPCTDLIEESGPWKLTFPSFPKRSWLFFLLRNFSLVIIKCLEGSTEGVLVENLPGKECLASTGLTVC